MQTTRMQRVSWAFYDFANSAFPTIISTFIFAAYFTQGIVGDEVLGTSLWGYATGLSALFIALFAPFLGAVADHNGRRKPWVFLFSFICVTASALLWFATPDQGSIVFALVCVGVATFGFEMGMVFYNTMMPSLAVPGREGTLSGLAWGLGYLGGLIGLFMVLVLFVQADTPLFGLDKDQLEHVRISGPFVALWFALFSLFFFVKVPDQPAKEPLSLSMRTGVLQLFSTLKNWRENPIVFKYLVARMIYNDGLNTLFAFGGIYAAGTFGMTFEDLIIFGIGINVTAGLGAALFGWLDDYWGPKRVILISVSALLLVGGGTLIVTDQTHFLVLGLLLGLFMGPAQAASRTYMAYVAPQNIRTESFGLYALSGKATAFLGPLMVGIFTDMFESQRAGMATILIFFVIGLALMRNLPDIRGQQTTS